MKICPKCARTYGDDAVHCRRCKLELAVAPEAYAAESDPKKRRRDWIFILISVPLFMLLMRFVLGYVSKFLK